MSASQLEVSGLLNKRNTSGDSKLRHAVIDAQKCKPKQCHQECAKHCPVNHSGGGGKLCVEAKSEMVKAIISDYLCIGCGMCIKKCPFKAIKILNLPSMVAGKTVHKYDNNAFTLFKLPSPRPGQILGLVGRNGIGKSTVLNILAGVIKPNFGDYSNPPEWSEIMKKFRGSELMTYFKKIVENKLTVVTKPQYISQVAKSIEGKVKDYLEKNDERGVKDKLIKDLEMENLLEKNVKDLSGGEIQRFCVALVVMKEADVYMFDEPSSFLDVNQRVAVVEVIKKLRSDNNYILVIEHDLATLDYLSDYICIMYGYSSAYGVVTLPKSTKDGINQYLEGYIPSENMRIRDKGLTFEVTEEGADIVDEKVHRYTYPSMSKTYDNFKIRVESGTYALSEIVVLMGPNGAGKSTFIKLLAGRETPDQDGVEIVYETVGYKPQNIKPSKKSANLTVKQVLLDNIQGNIASNLYVSEVLKPLKIESMYDLKLSQLSGGQLQTLYIAICLGHKSKPSMFLLDEPSAFLDVEQRLIVAKAIKRYVMHAKKSAFVVEHDLIMSTYLADSIIVFEGTAGVETTALAPKNLSSGMNHFLKDLDITFRKDPSNFRPRINKKGSIKDTEQRKAGNYFC